MPGLGASSRRTPGATTATVPGAMPDQAGSRGTAFASVTGAGESGDGEPAGVAASESPTATDVLRTRARRLGERDAVAGRDVCGFGAVLGDVAGITRQHDPQPRPVGHDAR